MPRQRSPNRDKAFEIYKEHKGNITLREIANILNEDEKKIAVWKQRDKWNDNSNVVQQKRKCCTTNKNNNKKTTPKEPIADEVKEVLRNTKLTEKQRLFCIHYIKYFNATKAYQKAYECDYITANTNGPRLLVNACIKKEIQKLKSGKLNRAMLSPDDIFQKYMDIAFTDINDFMEFGQKEVPMISSKTGEQLSDENGNPITYTIDYAHIRNSSEVDGSLISEISKGKDGAKVKLQDKMKALQWLSDRMDLLPTETKEKIKIEEEKLKLAKEKNEIDNKKFEEDTEVNNKLDNLADAIRKSAELINGEQ